MLRKTILPVIFIILGWGFWISPEFKTISAGVAIFMFGMLSLENGFKVFSGGVLERVLARSTDKLWKSLSFGVVSTSILQSSSLVSVITISFLSAGLIGLTQGMGIIFGSNLGTTTGAWLVAGFGLKVKISAYAMPILVFGIVLIFQKSKTLNGLGYVLAGLGFLFLGIHYMKEGFETFKDAIDLTQFAIGGMAGLMIYALIGIVATVIMQSSHATLVITITALASGQLSYENALAIAIGANVGTTITAILGSLSSNYQGKQLAAAHLVFNLVTGLLAIALLDHLLQLVEVISAYSGIDAQDFTLKLAVFHTLFNLLGVIVMVPLLQYLATLLQRFIKEKAVSRSKARYLNESTLAYPDTATEAIRNETLHMWDNTVDLFAHGIQVKVDELMNSDLQLEALIKQRKTSDIFDIDNYYNIKIKGIYGDIISYLSKAEFGWESEQSGEIHWLRRANQYMVEAIKDLKHLQKNLNRYSKGHNSAIKDQYDLFRYYIAEILRRLDEIRRADMSELHSLMIDELKIDYESMLDEQSERIDHLIRSGEISAEMGISLMNDKSYVYSMIQKFMQIGETLFVRHSKALSDLDKQMQLDEEEITEINEQVEQTPE